MICREFEKYIYGSTSKDEFDKHIQECQHCKKALAEYEILMKTAGTVTSVFPENRKHALWERIEKEIKGVKKTDSVKRVFVKFAAAALFILAVTGLINRVYYNTLKFNSSFLKDSALRKVENAEKKYELAINQLEKKAEPVIQNMDFELATLYREKLETINNQIKECKRELLYNPGNSRIRKYMLAALKDKKETLKEILKGVENET